MAICYKLQEAGRPSEGQDAQALSRSSSSWGWNSRVRTNPWTR